MLKRIRLFLEKIAFAGLKPNTPRSTPAGVKPKGHLGGLLDRFLSGGAQADPLYLTNRSAAQKLKTGLAIGIPLVLVAAGVVVVIMGLAGSPTAPPPPAEVTPAQVANKMLPDLSKSLNIPTDHTLEVLDARIDRAGPAKLVGTVRNTTGSTVEGAEMIFDITNREGSRVGAVSVRVAHVPPNGSVQFEAPVTQERAAFALVREIHRL